MLNFKPEELPPLDGYDFSEPKTDAQVVLATSREDPLLAKWQYGLGRVIAWTADDGSDLAMDWALSVEQGGWGRYDEFWGNMIGWVLPDPERRPMQVSVARDGPEAILTVDAVGEDGDYVDLAETTVTITTPSGNIVGPQPLHQTGPGRYQVRVAAPEAGAYQVQLSQVRGETTITDEAGFAVPPSPELQPDPGAASLMTAVAGRTGGRVLSLSDPAAAFADDGLSGTALREYRSIWAWPLAVALVALLAEIAVRTRFFAWVARRTG
jgi:hypothetical protein